MLNNFFQFDDKLKMRTTAVGNNCAVHALTHPFVDMLINGQLDGSFNENYEKLLRSFYTYYGIRKPKSDATAIHRFKAFLQEYASNPVKLELILGPVFRLYLKECLINDNAYKNFYYRIFRTFVASEIANKKPEGMDDRLNGPTTRKHIDSLKADYAKVQATESLDQFLVRKEVDIQQHWNNEGYQAYITRLTNEKNCLTITIDEISSLAKSLGFNLEIYYRGCTKPETNNALNAKHFIQMFNNGGHWEVAAVTPIKATAHNAFYTLKPYTYDDPEKRLFEPLFDLNPDTVNAGRVALNQHIKKTYENLKVPLVKIPPVKPDNEKNVDELFEDMIAEIATKSPQELDSFRQSLNAARHSLLGDFQNEYNAIVNLPAYKDITCATEAELSSLQRQFDKEFEDLKQRHLGQLFKDPTTKSGSSTRSVLRDKLRGRLVSIQSGLLGDVGYKEKLQKCHDRAEQYVTELEKQINYINSISAPKLVMKPKAAEPEAMEPVERLKAKKPKAEKLKSAEKPKAAEKSKAEEAKSEEADWRKPVALHPAKTIASVTKDDTTYGTAKIFKDKELVGGITFNPKEVSDKDLKQLHSKDGKQFTSTSGHTYRMRMDNKDHMVVDMPMKFAVKIEGETPEQNQQRLLLAMVDMVSVVACNSDEMNIYGSNLTMVAVGYLFAQHLAEKDMGGTKVAWKTLTSSPPWADLTAQHPDIVANAQRFVTDYIAKNPDATRIAEESSYNYRNAAALGG